MSDAAQAEEVKNAETEAADQTAAQKAFEGEFSESAKPAAAKPEAKPEQKHEAKVDDGAIKPDPKVVAAAAAQHASEAEARAKAEAEWAGVAPKVRQMLEGISGKVGELDKIDHRLKGVEGRTGAALKGVETLRAALEAAKTTAGSGGAAPTKEQIAAAAGSSVKWKQAKEDYPDWAEAMEERLAAFPSGSATAAVDVESLKRDLGDIVATATSEAKAEARELAKIDRKHENWETTINTPEFTAWRKAQPPEIQALGASTHAADAIRMLDAFDLHVKAVAEATARAAANKKRLDGAVQPKGGAAPASNRNVSEEAQAQQAFNAQFP